jgi:hypothetical protein
VFKTVTLFYIHCGGGDMAQTTIVQWHVRMQMTIQQQDTVHCTTTISGCSLGGRFVAKPHAMHFQLLVCLFVFTRPGGTHDRCFQPVTRFLPSLGQNPPRGPIKPRVTQMAYVFWSLPHDAINTGLTAAPASPLYGSPRPKDSQNHTTVRH